MSVKPFYEISNVYRSHIERKMFVFISNQVVIKNGTRCVIFTLLPSQPWRLASRLICGYFLVLY